MKRYEYIYFYKDLFRHWIPLSTGSTNDLSMVLWMNEELKKDLHRAGCKSSTKLFIYIDGRVFLVRNSPFALKLTQQ